MENIVLIDSIGLTTAEDIEAKKAKTPKYDEKTVLFIGVNDIVFDKISKELKVKGVKLVKADLEDLNEKYTKLKDSREQVRVMNIARSYAMQLKTSVIYEEEIIDIATVAPIIRNAFSALNEFEPCESKCRRIVSYLEGNPRVFRGITYTSYIGFYEYEQRHGYVCNGILNGEVVEKFRDGDYKENNYDPIFFLSKQNAILGDMDKETKYNISHLKIAVDKLITKLKTIYK